MTWDNGGVMAGMGQTIATGDVSIGNAIIYTRSFTIDGTATLSAYLDFYNSASVSIAATATVDALYGADMFDDDSSSPTFSNAGDLTVNVGAENSVLDDGVAFTNSGTVAVSTGTLDLEDPGGTDSGSFTVASNATLSFGETAVTLSSQSSISGDGTVLFTNHVSATIDGAYTLGSGDGTTSLLDGSVNFDAPVTSLGNELKINYSTANLGSNSLSVESLDLSGGELTGTGTLSVSGALDWSGGTMAGTGETIAEGTVSISSATLDTRSFTSDATTTLSGSLSFDNSAGFTSAAAATFNAQPGASLDRSDGSAPTFDNAGSFSAQAGVSTVTDNGVAFTNTGTVDLTSGTLSLSDMTLTNSSVINQSGSCTLQIKSGATLNIASSGTYTWSGGTLQVDGTLASGSAVTVSTGATLDGVGTIGGTVNVQAGGHLAPGDAVDDPGILNTASPTLASGANFDAFLNGTTAGTQYSQLSSTGTVNLASAELNLAGAFLSASGDVFTIVRAASVTGTFNGLAQNAVIPFNGHSLTVSYTPSTVTLTDTTVEITPTIAWTTPDPIIYGTALGTSQLDATASYDGQTIAGTYKYTYPAGLGGLLNAGSSQTLTVLFTPSDPTTYNSSTGTTRINVLPAPLTVAVNPATRSYGLANSTFTVTYSGFVSGQGPDVLSGGLAFDTSAAPGSNVGSYAVSADGVSSRNYAVNYVPGELRIVPEALTFTALYLERNFKAKNPRLAFEVNGLVLGQSTKQAFKGAPAVSTTATKKSPPGRYPIVVKHGTLKLINKNYTLDFANAILQVVGKASR